MSKLDKLNDDIAKSVERTEQLKRQKKAVEAREKQRERATDTRRKIISGAILLDVFPQFNALQPQRSNAENSAAFAPLAHFLLNLRDELAADKDLETRLNRQRVTTTPENQQ
jgi:hypothetical protein